MSYNINTDHNNRLSKLNIYLSSDTDNCGTDETVDTCKIFDQALLLSLVDNISMILIVEDYPDILDLRLIENTLQDFSNQELETLNEQISQNPENKTPCIELWLDLLLKQTFSTNAQNLTYKLITKNAERIKDSPTILLKLKQGAEECITKNPSSAHNFLITLQESAILPPADYQKLALLLTYVLAQTSGREAAPMISSHLASILPIVEQDLSILTETFKCPADYINTAITKLLGAFNEKEALQLLNAAAHGKVISLNDPKFFHHSLHLLSHHFSSPGTSLFQWDLFQQLSRKMLTDAQTFELKKKISSMPIHQLPSWITADQDMQADLKHLDESSLFLNPRIELNVRLKIVEKAIDHGFVQWILPNLYRIIKLAQQLDDQKAQVQVKHTFTQLVQTLCHKEWTLTDQQTAQAIFEQSTKNPDFTLPKGLYILLLEHAAEQSKGKHYLFSAIDHLLKNNETQPSYEETLACFYALNKIGSQKNTIINKQRRLALINALLAHKQPLQALRLLESDYLEKNTLYIQLVKQSFSLIFKLENNNKTDSIEICERFLKTIHSQHLTTSYLIPIFQILFSTYLETKNLQQLNTWQHRFKEHLADPLSPIWNNQFAMHCVKLCLRQKEFSPEMTFFLGEFLGTYSASFLNVNQRTKIVQKILTNTFQNRIENAKHLMLLLMSSYKIGGEKEWGFLIDLALSNPKTPFASDILNSFITRSKETSSHSESCYPRILELCKSAGTVAQKIALLREYSHLSSNFNELVKKQNIDLLENIQAILVCQPLQEKQKYRSHLSLIIENLNTHCDLWISEDKKKAWTLFLENIPAPKSIQSAYLNFKNALKLNKKVGSSFQQLVSFKYPEEIKELYEKLILDAVELLLEQKKSEFSPLKALEYLLSQQTHVCNKMAQKLALELMTKSIQKKEIISFHTCLKTLISRASDSIFLEEVQKIACEKHAFSIGQIAELDASIHSKKLEIQFLKFQKDINENASVLKQQTELNAFLRNLNSAKELLPYLSKIWDIYHLPSLDNSNLRFLFNILRHCVTLSASAQEKIGIDKQMTTCMTDLITISEKFILNDEEDGFKKFNTKALDFFQFLLDHNKSQFASKWVHAFLSLSIPEEWVDSSFKKEWGDIIQSHKEVCCCIKDCKVQNYKKPKVKRVKNTNARVEELFPLKNTTLNEIAKTLGKTTTKNTAQKQKAALKSLSFLQQNLNLLNFTAKILQKPDLFLKDLK
jgi:hypothetical protein